MEIGDRNGRPVSTIRQLTVIMFDEEIHFRLISVIVDTLQSIRQPTGRLAPALARLATSSLVNPSPMWSHSSRREGWGRHRHCRVTNVHNVGSRAAWPARGTWHVARVCLCPGRRMSPH